MAEYEKWQSERYSIGCKVWEARCPNCHELVESADPISSNYRFCPYCGFDMKSNFQCATDHRQLAEWLTELKEWKENPFRRIKAECKENYYCNNCAFIDHCPFSNGNRVVAEYPMDWVIY